MHPDAVVGLLGDRVVPLHIEPETADAAVLCGQVLDRLVKTAIQPLPSKFRDDVDALYPPELPVSPVAPLRGDHQGAGYFPVGDGNQVKSQVAILDQAPCSAQGDIRVQVQALGFPGHADVEPGDCRSILPVRPANENR